MSDRNADILEQLLTLKAAWGDAGPDPENLAALARVRTLGGRFGRTIGDDVMVPHLWAEVLQRDALLHEAFEMLGLAIDALRRPSSALRARKEAHVLRAGQLRLAGLSVAQIGVRMGAEDGRAAYPERTVARWLAVARTARNP